MEKGQGACKGETTKLGLSPAHQSQSLAPSTYSTERHLEPRECGSSTGAQRGQDKMEWKFRHPFQLNAKHCEEVGES